MLTWDAFKVRQCAPNGSQESDIKMEMLTRQVILSNLSILRCFSSSNIGWFFQIFPFLGVFLSSILANLVWLCSILVWFFQFLCERTLMKVLQMISHTAADPEAYPELPSEVNLPFLSPLGCLQMFPLLRWTTSWASAHWSPQPPPLSTSRQPSHMWPPSTRRSTSRPGSTCASGGSTVTGSSTPSAWAWWVFPTNFKTVAILNCTVFFNRCFSLSRCHKICGCFTQFLLQGRLGMWVRSPVWICVTCF